MRQIHGAQRSFAINRIGDGYIAIATAEIIVGCGPPAQHTPECAYITLATRSGRRRQSRHRTLRVPAPTQKERRGIMLPDDFSGRSIIGAETSVHAPANRRRPTLGGFETCAIERTGGRQDEARSGRSQWVEHPATASPLSPDGLPHGRRRGCRTGHNCLHDTRTRRCLPRPRIHIRRPRASPT